MPDKPLEVESHQTNGNIIIQGVKNYHVESMYKSFFINDKEFNTFIKNVEKIVRTSDLYSYYISVLKLNGLDSDAIMGNMCDEDVEIEMHHYPLTLYEIVEIIILNEVKNKNNISTFLISKLVMDEHFHNNIGIVMLSKNNHILAHEKKIRIGKKLIYGNYSLFIDKYKEVIHESIINKINKINEIDVVDGIEILDSSKRLSYKNTTLLYHDEIKKIIE